MEGVVHRTQRAPLDEKHAFTFLYDRQQLPAQCEVEVGGDYYYIGPQRAGLPPNLKVRSGKTRSARLRRGSQTHQSDSLVVVGSVGIQKAENERWGECQLSPTQV